MKLLDDAWADRGRTHVVVLVAPGGVGKTTLVKRWLDRLRTDGWRGAGRVYGWSFYSQGTSEDRQASDDPFLNDALRWFGVEHDPALSPWDKGRLLAGAIARSHTLLVLDGLEPLQYPPGPQGGALRAPGVQALLRVLASAGQPGLCVVTTREAVGDLAEYERTADHPAGGVLAHDLGNLADTDGARLLHRLGVAWAGAAAIVEDDAELRAASREVRGHALALTLLGSYLKLAHGGDIRRRDLVKFEEADEEVEGGKAFRIMDAYVAWLKTSKHNRALTAVLRLLGLFDRPADAACHAALRAEPVIAGLTEPLVGLSEAQWSITLQRLAECRLIQPVEGNSIVDTHPLVREYFAKQLRERQPEAWREGHRRLYEHLKSSVPHRPEGLAGLQPLYQAVAHGCKARLHQQACDEVYVDRILRGAGDGGYYSARKLGAFGTDLGAVACFFEEPWKRLAPGLSEGDCAWLINQAAYHLRALGRLTESLEPMRVGMEMPVTLGQYNQAARFASNLSELQLTLGETAAAVRDGERSVDLADRSGDAFMRMASRTTLADARHQSGARPEALALFREAEAIQVQRQPEYQFLYSLPGYQYCDLLLGDAECMAWATTVALIPAATDRLKLQPQLDTLKKAEQRAAKMYEWRLPSDPLLDIALDRLTLGRVALYQAILESSSFKPAREPLTAAVHGLRTAGDLTRVPWGLLTRAWLRFVEGDATGARADLDESWQIAERGAMKLPMADIHLHRARLFRDRKALDAAAKLIAETGYRRRDGELADACEALNHPQS